MTHYTKTKEEKTAELMERVLDILVHSTEPITLKKKEYKKINFSQGQVTDAVQEYAQPEDHIEGIVFRDSSTISHNSNYKKLILRAKAKRAEWLAGDSELIFEERELTNTELKIEIDRLLFEKEKLAKANRGLESIIRQAELEEALVDQNNKKELVSEPVGVDAKLISVLEKLLLLNSRNESIFIEKGRGHKPSQVFYHGYEGSVLLCNANDLGSLNITYDVDRNGKISIVQKGILDA